ncbi:hypothetical protein ALO_05068 [Acetonema longum DSM 6540]|uniref:Uncharacterized protein n=1 Tax=Acetonema longum DSM 6540 TaxID=1009370 RepID=F7NG27_9FIRM|nr:hypothetical protein ALO_05068 [Acetonema longum DSM 6540]
MQLPSTKLNLPIEEMNYANQRRRCYDGLTQAAVIFQPAICRQRPNYKKVGCI